MPRGQVDDGAEVVAVSDEEVAERDRGAYAGEQRIVREALHDLERDATRGGGVMHSEHHLVADELHDTAVVRGDHISGVLLECFDGSSDVLQRNAERESR